MSDDDKSFIARVLEQWDKGLDTVDIAAALGETEAVIATALHIGLEERRRRVREV